MTEQLQLRRGTATQVAAFTGAQGEVVVDTTNNRAVVNDGSTAGGWPAAKLSEVVTNTRTAVADASYAALSADRSIAFTTLTAARVVTLPASNAYPTGTTLTVFDESGACSATNTITLAAAGSDLIDGASSAVVSIAYGYLALQSNGAGKWTIVDQASTNLAAVAIGTTFDPNNVLSVKGASALFSGTNFSITINKGAAADTASLIFEDGFSGRAQMGLNGSDNFSFKVSSNGSTWTTAIALDATTGVATLANQRTAVSDASYTALVTDRLIAYTALTAARTVTLPAAASYPPGQQLVVADEAGACSATNTITLLRAGSDTINGATSAVITAAYGYLALESNGSNAWAIIDQSSPPVAAIASGTINGAAIGGTTPSSGAFTTLSASSTVSGAGFSSYLASPPASGGATPAAVSAAAPAHGDSSSRAITSAWFGQNLPGGGLNKFRNGAFDVAQRGTSSSVSAGTSAYTLDGWIVSATGAAAAWAQQYGSGTYGNPLVLSAASGLTAVSVMQRIESVVATQLLAGLAIQPITVQFQIYNGTSAPITPTLSTGYAASRDNFSSVTADLAATNLQTIAAGASGVVAYTFTPSLYVLYGYQIALNFGGALNASSGAVYISRADVRATPGLATGLNNSPPPPEMRPIGAELALCQRYFVAVANEFIGNTLTSGAIGGVAYFPVVMRATPTISNGSFAAGGSNNGTFAASAVAAYGFNAYNSAGNWSSPGYNVQATYQASAEL
jgi:hypothetical protein